MPRTPLLTCNCNYLTLDRCKRAKESEVPKGTMDVPKGASARRGCLLLMNSTGVSAGLGSESRSAHY